MGKQVITKAVHFGQSMGTVIGFVLLQDTADVLVISSCEGGRECRRRRGGEGGRNGGVWVRWVGVIYKGRFGEAGEGGAKWTIEMMGVAFQSRWGVCVSKH